MRLARIEKHYYYFIWSFKTTRYSAMQRAEDIKWTLFGLHTIYSEAPSVRGWIYSNKWQFIVWGANPTPHAAQSSSWLDEHVCSVSAFFIGIQGSMVNYVYGHACENGYTTTTAPRPGRPNLKKMGCCSWIVFYVHSRRPYKLCAYRFNTVITSIRIER